MKTITKQKAISKKEVKLPKNWGKIKVDGELVDFTTMKESPHCLHCYDEGAREQAEVFEKYIELDEAIDQYHLWNKIGKVEVNYCAIILCIMLLGIVVAMITTNYGYGFINA